MIDYPQYRVKEVYDGDNLIVIGNQGEELKVRFACTDAPEIAQEYGIKSRDFLRSRLRYVENEVYLNVVDKEYDSIVAEVFIQDGDRVRLIQEIQARKGMVFPHAKYNSNCPNWDLVEEAGAIAKEKRLGVWESENPEYPWEWRKSNK